jgi:iron complex transport system ATP-binding protein
MLAVEALAYGCAVRTIGRDLSFALADGEVLCVLGPNGGGKTTLFRTILGLIAPHGGAIRLDGRSLAELPRAEVARRIGYVPQAHAGYFAYTVREMVLMGRTAHLGAFAVPGTRDREVAAQAIESLGIAHLAERPFTAISGGERQLALVARALAQEPRLLVMDEPTASLDFGNQVRVLERIGELAARRIAVLFSTHDPDHAFLCAQRALLLVEGRMLELGPPREVIRAETLARMYRVSVRVLAAGDGLHACLPELRRPGS